MVRPCSSFASIARRWLFPLMCPLALGACSERTTGVVRDPAVPSQAIAAFESGVVLDPGIDQTDSYLVTTSVTRTTSTVESAEPFVDPLTGQTVTSLQLPEVVDSTHFEAGYDAAGTVRMTEYSAGTDSGGAAGKVQIVGNSATFYDQSGAVVDDSAGAILMDAIGSVDDVIVTSETILSVDTSLARPTRAGAAPSQRVDGAVESGAHIERRGDRLTKTFPLDDPSASLRGERVREYRRSAGDWVLTEERATTTQGSGAISYTTVQRTVYPVVQWKTDDVRDQRRRERRKDQGGGSAPALGLASVMRNAAAAPVAPEPIISSAAATVTCLQCANPGTGGGGTGSVSPTAGMNVAFQHGAFSDANSWYRMDPWISARYPIAQKVKPSLDWRASIESQATTLQSTLVSTGATGFLVIGHSNGGLIARRVGQLPSLTPTPTPLVGGVIAVAAPHRGLPLALNTRTAVTSLLTAHLREVLSNAGSACGVRQYASVCAWMNDALLTLVPRLVNYALDASAPMSSEVQPGSTYLANLNARPESFLRYSVEVQSQGAWKFIRLLGDWRCEPEQSCSGDHLQNAMESIYDVLRTCGSNEISKILAPSVANRCANVRWSLSHLNLAYERLTAPGDLSDGIVPAKSQQYPGVPDLDRGILKNARESHTGELKSGAVRQKIFDMIDRYRSLS